MAKLPEIHGHEEISAMTRIALLLDALGEGGKRRVMVWLADRYSVVAEKECRHPGYGLGS